jgi:hypothetical protein
MESRTVWHYALCDIESTVQIPQLHNKLSRLSSVDLRLQALKAFRLHWSWYKSETIKPKSVQTLCFETDLCHARFIPGGDWILMVSSHRSHRTLQLHHVRCMESPMACVRTPSSSPMPYTTYRCRQLSVFISSRQEQRAIVVEARYGDT